MLLTTSNAPCRRPAKDGSAPGGANTQCGGDLRGVSVYLEPIEHVVQHAARPHAHDPEMILLANPDDEALVL